jgi:outer membrane protein TolC
MTEEDVVLQVAKGYWSLFQARRVHAYALRNVERLTSYLNDTRNLMDAGMATTNDLLKVEVQLSNAKVKEIEGRNGARLSEIELNTVMGLPPESHIELASEPDEPTAGDAVPDDRQGLDSLVQRALRRRGDLLAAETMAEAAGAAVKVEEGAWWPQIDFTANYLYNNPHQRYQPLTEEFLGTWDVGVSFSLDLWNWGATTSRVERAEAQLRQVQLHQLALRDQIVLEVHRVVLEVLEAKEKLSVAGLAVRQAEENLETTARKYRAGLTSTTELIDAEVSLLQTQTQLSGAEAELAVALAGLRHAIGGPGATGRK